MPSDEIQSHAPRRIDDRQKSVLKQSFANEPYPDKETKLKLSEQLGLKEKTVQIWFTSERAKIRKAKDLLLPDRRFMCVCVFGPCLCTK